MVTKKWTNIFLFKIPKNLPASSCKFSPFCVTIFFFKSEISFFPEFFQLKVCVFFLWWYFDERSSKKCPFSQPNRYQWGSGIVNVRSQRVQQRVEVLFFVEKFKGEIIFKNWNYQKSVAHIKRKVWSIKQIKKTQTEKGFRWFFVFFLFSTKEKKKKQEKKSWKEKCWCTCNIHMYPMAKSVTRVPKQIVSPSPSPPSSLSLSST